MVWGSDQLNSLTELVITPQEKFQSEQYGQLPHISGDLLLQPLRQWLDRIEIDDPKVAQFLCKAIPGECPFARDIVLFGRKIGHIPPLCKLNPFYEQFVGLRFRALCFLADSSEAAHLDGIQM
jgi:hypothetical protein